MLALPTDHSAHRTLEGSRQPMNQPQIWHYGLVAREWAEFETEGGPEGYHGYQPYPAQALPGREW